MYLYISSSLSLSNHPWISQNENCILINSSLPLIRAFWDPLISQFWSPQDKYGFPSKHLTSSVTEYLLVLWGSVYHRGGWGRWVWGGGGGGGGGGGQSTTIVFWPGGHFTMGVKILSHRYVSRWCSNLSPGTLKDDSTIYTRLLPPKRKQKVW